MIAAIETAHWRTVSKRSNARQEWRVFPENFQAALLGQGREQKLKHSSALVLHQPTRTRQMHAANPKHSLRCPCPERMAEWAIRRADSEIYRKNKTVQRKDAHENKPRAMSHRLTGEALLGIG